MLKHRHVIEQMTLPEKCFMLSGKDFWNTRGIEHAGVPQMMMADGPHGVRKQEDGGDQLGLGGSVPATCYPTAATMANSWDPALGEELGACCVVVVDAHTHEVVETASTSGRVTEEYVPGLLAFRELPLFLEAFARLEHTPDVVVFDGTLS